MDKAKKGDMVFSVLWVFLGVYVSAYSYSLGLGEVRTPGAGFMPFFFGLFLTVFSIINLAGYFGKDKDKNDVPRQWYSPSAYMNIGIMVGTLLVYGILVERIGFLIMTCIALTVLFRISGCKWKISVIWGPVIGCLSYFVFTYLGVMLPAGIIRL